MEPDAKIARLQKALVDVTARRKKLGEENLELRTSVQDLLDVHHQQIHTLLGTVNKRQIRFRSSSKGRQPSILDSILEASLARVSRMLIEAQEQERARIARELHDDINQRLALLTMAIEQARQDLIGAFPSKVDQCLRELKHEVIGIATDIHTIAHDLHSSSLEYLGLVPAVTKFAEEIGKRHGIQIEIENEGMLGALPPEISLCLFRVVQEGLHNAARHSGTKRVEVLLQQTKTQIHVALTDSGKGFDVAGTASGQGLGLASMRERIRLVHGKIVIQSEPALGTSIHAWVPLQANGIPNIGSSETTVIADNSRLHSFSDYKRK